VRQLLAKRKRDAAALPATSGRHILVVEDNADSRQLVCELLSLLGHAPQGVDSAEEALPLLRDQSFEVLFTDFRLPGMNGLELARTAKREQPQLRIIFASGYGEAIEGMQDLDCLVLGKPYNLSRLQDALNEA
jgi:CheY-like chemotaxis protein